LIDEGEMTMEGRDVEKGQRDDSGGCRRRGKTRVVGGGALQ